MSRATTKWKQIAAWHAIYDTDGAFRGYEWALDENGKPRDSLVYAQEGRSPSGEPLAPEQPP